MGLEFSFKDGRGRGPLDVSSSNKGLGPVFVRVNGWCHFPEGQARNTIKAVHRIGLIAEDTSHY